ncbi:TPA: relaxase/mobilization nuclease domain-containing protein [Enterobacter hormaechei subsp. steigerwaltii]|uniref:relaxase/mobilization nuclease domain-containing protein n=1 Tax=Escherichia coli TaxID=562 RepID=UPI001389FFC9|nr:relaxase/mobilization nuclease domain-containing protein [Escherichia coli]HDS7217772.1 relaxase/mobilization nuclease domain-containing protein [Klebsiella aerogenes]HDV8949891.1 relaxase/mobilization nuclease domain-containing protein [Enterobacter hormaechei subsp. steigerwaltii]MCI2819747.1 relaxase/mobilization nuclease domain-containing protein [Escherichia coli]NDI89549.1 relaxase/mobilization nuclease domain-containing protein [Escherichia coli]HAM9762428.1 relaxase/mobilization nuc
MKGMQTIRRGKSFAGVVLYALKPCSHHKKDPIVIGGNITIVGNSAKDLIAEFDSTKQLRPNVAKAVWHNSLRLPKNEALTNSEWANIADDYMARMGFSETHLRCYVLHDDEDGQHIHIIASRVSLDAGKLYLGKNENLISTRIIQELEKDYQLTRTKGPGALKPSASPVKRKKSRNEAMLEERTGEPCPKSIIQRGIDSITLNPIAIDDFVEKLNSMGITAKCNIASTGKMNGFSFECKGVVFKASQLGKKYSWKNLESMISMNSSSHIASERPVIPVPDTSHSNEAVISIVEDHPDEKIYPEIGVSLPRPDTAPTKPTSMTMRWIATIPYLVSVISALKTMRIPFLKAFNGPRKFFSVSMIHLSSISLKQTKTDNFKPKSSHQKAHKPLLP